MCQGGSKSVFVVILFIFFLGGGCLGLYFVIVWRFFLPGLMIG